MTKNTIGRWLVALVLMMLSSSVFAADPLYRMLHADEVKSFQEEQDTLIVAQLLETQANKFAVKVIKVITGSVADNTIFVDSQFNYSYLQQLPASNDYAVMSLKQIEDRVYQAAWGVFKADQSDYKQLNLLADKDSDNGDLAAIEWFINSAGKERDFFFEGDKAYVKRTNGETLQIYPKPVGQNNALILSTTNSQSNELVFGVIALLLVIVSIFFSKTGKA